MVDLLLTLVSGGTGTLATIGTVVAVFISWGGYQYLKGRKHARQKADSEMQEAFDDLAEDIESARRAGDRIDRRRLRDDDGYRRD